MLKKNKWLILITAIVTLLPIVIGVILWDQLPEQVPAHWGIDGQVDGWASKGFTVFAFPFIMLAIHLVCIFAAAMDPKHETYKGKPLQLVLWICPVLNLILNTLVYTTALGYDFMNVPLLMCLLVGVMFIVVGNWLPKCRQSYTMGIKLPWTLDSEENWNATHRFGGWVWVGCGVVMLATAFLACFWVLLGVMVVAVGAPTIYSYLYYRKHKKGTA